MELMIARGARGKWPDGEDGAERYLSNKNFQRNFILERVTILRSDTPEVHLFGAFHVTVSWEGGGNQMCVCGGGGSALFIVPS